MEGVYVARRCGFESRSLRVIKSLKSKKRLWRIVTRPVHWAWFWSGWARCPVGWHQYRVFYITDGSTTVWCLFCRDKREPTAEELAAHPNVNLTLEQQASRDAEIEEVLQWLKRNGHA